MIKGWPTLCLSALSVVRVRESANCLAFMLYLHCLQVSQLQEELQQMAEGHQQETDRQVTQAQACLQAELHTWERLCRSVILFESTQCFLNVHVLKSSSSMWQRRRVFQKASLACLPSVLDEVILQVSVYGCLHGTARMEQDLASKSKV